LTVATAAARSGAARAALIAGALVVAVACAALGSWQVQRRAWKLDLIERVEQRVHALPIAAPAPAQWPQVSAASDEYRAVRLQGRFLHDLETLVQANTELGAGFWVLTPLQRNDGTVVLVNRGFVPSDARARDTRRDMEPVGEVTVTGLLRITESGGGFLRQNDAPADRWYSRDVAAIGAAHGLNAARLAPYFVDEAASAARAPDAWPRGGLTIIQFRNSHLVYALTWFTLALMAAVGAAHVWRSDKRRGRKDFDEPHGDNARSAAPTPDP
jgi:surfeit locus 1 family protein